VEWVVGQKSKSTKLVSKVYKRSQLYTQAVRLNIVSVLLPHATVDYRCEDGRFPVSTSFMTISTLICFSAVKQGLILEQEAEKALI
jgi:hypothetical protein